MKVKFQTNLDWYQTVAWPVLDNIIPPIGSLVFVHPGSERFCESNNLPFGLSVVGIHILHNQIICELWYDKKLIEHASPKTIKHLMKQ